MDAAARPFELARAVILQSIDRPLARIGLAHFSISAGRKRARNSGVLCSAGTMLMPTPSMRSRTDGVSTAALAALLSRRTIASGVPLGKNNPYQPETASAGTPCSAAVVRSGSAGLRLGAKIAIAFTVLP